jgi:hypothetical protein
MFRHHQEPKDLFTEGCNSLLGSVLLFGVALITLAVLIFMYPALLGIMFATLILLVGAGALYGSYKLYRFKQHINKLESEGVPIRAEVRTEGPHYRHHRITMILR